MPSFLPSAQLQTFGFWGDKARQPFVFDIATPDLKRQAQLGMGHGLSAAARTSQPYQRGVRRLYDDEKAPLCLTWNRSFPTAWNSVTAWGSGTYLKRLRGSFDGSSYALIHEIGATTQNATYTSTFALLKNQPFSLRLFVFKDIEAAQRPIVSIKWDRWLIQIVGGNATIARLAPTWTQTLQDANDVKVGAAEANPDVNWDAEIDEFRQAHYEAFESLGGYTNTNEGADFDWEIVPEPLGALTILSNVSRGKQDATRIEIPALIEAADLAPEAEQTIYAAGAISFNTRGPAFQWQIGEHLHSAAIGITTDTAEEYHGQIICPTRIYADPTGTDLDDLYALLRTSLPADTHIDYSVEDIGPRGYNDDGSPTAEHFHELGITFSSPSHRYTPFLYSGQLVLPARPHVGAASSESYNSNDYKLAGHAPPYPGAIDDVTLDCEGEGWRTRVTVSIYDVEGTGLPITPLYSARENRVANVSVNGGYILRNGLVVSADRTDMARFEMGLTGTQVAKVSSMAVLQVLDGWAILEEQEQMSPLNLDGLRLGDAARRILRDAGWSDSEISDIPTTFGRVLPKARLGEDALIKCSGSPGAMLRQLFEDYGMGAIPYHDPLTGRWAVWQPGGAPSFAFSSSASYASRNWMQGPLDFTRDYSDCFNEIVVIGGTDTRGVTVSRSWTLSAGYRTDFSDGFESGLYYTGHIGRRKRKVIERRELRRADDVDWVLRSNVQQYGNSGRFASVKTAAHMHLRPGMTGTLDGQSYTLFRMGAASAKADEAVNVYRQVVATFI